MINKIKEFVKKLVEKISKKKEKKAEESDDSSSAQSESEALVEHIDEKMDIILPSFTEEERDTILDIIRPIIKGYNSDDAYLKVCRSICDSKTLKTFATMSEDGKSIFIKLTQSNIFNEKIANFIAEKVVASFKMSIYGEYAGKYDISAENGIITITKVG